MIYFLALTVCGAAAAPAAGLPPFLVTNDDTASAYPPSTVTFHTIEADGSLASGVRVSTEGNGVAGGYFGASRLVITTQAGQTCLFASNAQSESITGFDAASRARSGVFRGSHADTSLAENGIPLAASAARLYAAFAGAGTIGAFQIEPGCTLRFLGDTPARGLGGGPAAGLAARGDMLVAAYGDGSADSFDIAGKLPVSHDDALYTAGRVDDFAPGDVDITADGRFAIFGGSSTTTVVQVAGLASGKLAKPVTYALGSGWNAGNVRLSPDETVLYISNSSGGRITAAFFDKATGTLRPGCSSAALRGFYAKFTSIGAAVTQLPTGTGGLLYVPEFNADGNSAIGILRYTTTGAGCALLEIAQSPVPAGPDAALLSLAIFPPRPF